MYDNPKNKHFNFAPFNNKKQKLAKIIKVICPFPTQFLNGTDKKKRKSIKYVLKKFILLFLQRKSTMINPNKIFIMLHNNFAELQSK